MVEAERSCDPALRTQGRTRQTGEDETPGPHPHRNAPARRAWWRPRRGVVGKAPFEDVWREERMRVRALAARLTGSADDAEDITQEVAVRALRGWDAFRGNAAVRTWLYRITLNVAARSPAHTAAEEGSAETRETAAPRHCQPEERLLRAEGAPALHEALAALPDEFRVPLVLQVYEEMKCREIADLLGLPLGTVLSRLHTARKRILAHLSEREIDENAL